MESGTSWSAHQLTEFLAAVSGVPDAAAALRAGVERATEALEADVGALVSQDGVAAAIGYARGQLPESELLAAAQARDGVLDVAGVGPCRVLSVRFDDLPEGRLLVARSGDEPYSLDERNLMRGLARVLSLSLRGAGVLAEERRLRQESERQAEQNARLLSSLRERQALLERLSLIQRAISSRAPLSEVLDVIAIGAQELLDAEVVGLRRLDPQRPGWLELVASAGLTPEVAAEHRSSRIGEGVGGRAAAEDRLVVIENYSEAPDALASLGTFVTTAMAAPVHENGAVVGSLVVASRAPDRSFGPAEQEILMAFADHASLAMTDAVTVKALRGALESGLHDAMHDRLTGLPNRALLNDRLTAAFYRAALQGTGLAILFLDLDGFKRVNDNLGHTVGDQLLVAVGERLSACVRAVDTTARLGGDEFALLLEGIEDPLEAEKVADDVLATLRTPFVLAGHAMTISASIGIAHHDHLDETHDLLRYADLAMYEAKEGGKGRHRRFEPVMQSRSLARLDTETALRQAVQEGRILVHFQPIVDLRDGVMVGTEALARWHHPERGFVPPTEFIPVAEATGMIVPLGKLVLLEACRQTRVWGDAHRDRPLPSVNVNISAVQFQTTGLVDLVVSVLEQTGLAPHLLSLEITEGTLMQDTQATLDVVHQLKALGVRLAVDDFGTGHSSLSYLRRFPIDVVKIDKSFVDGVARDEHQAALAHAIIKLAHTLNLQSVGEGIEQAGQAVTLRSLGCDFAQGYFFARPMPQEQVSELFRLPTLQPPSPLWLAPKRQRVGQQLASLRAAPKALTS